MYCRFFYFKASSFLGMFSILDICSQKLNHNLRSQDDGGISGFYAIGVSKHLFDAGKSRTL